MGKAKDTMPSNSRYHIEFIDEVIKALVDGGHLN